MCLYHNLCSKSPKLRLIICFLSFLAMIDIADVNFFMQIFITFLLNDREYGSSYVLPYCFPKELLLIYNTMPPILYP